MNQEKLIAIHKNHDGRIISFQTTSGRIISYRKALAEAAEGIITGVHLTMDTDGIGVLMSSEGPALEQYPPIY
ncbi:DUF3892 domain-containing protein [Bacillus sp. REN3]|uniref:DUF3892 domain-containing protein n=1 Tax=Bacillus sp. REN3 TaxID=2802440 RepID=UPI001AEE1710|nr:DUF3892 domain-containing protein [Bacillus sp. REN3]